MNQNKKSILPLLLISILAITPAAGCGAEPVWDDNVPLKTAAWEKGEISKWKEAEDKAMEAEPAGSGGMEALEEFGEYLVELIRTGKGRELDACRISRTLTFEETAAMADINGDGLSDILEYGLPQRCGSGKCESSLTVYIQKPAGTYHVQRYPLFETPWDEEYNLLNGRADILKFHDRIYLAARQYVEDPDFEREGRRPVLWLYRFGQGKVQDRLFLDISASETISVLERF